MNHTWDCPRFVYCIYVRAQRRYTKANSVDIARRSLFAMLQNCEMKEIIDSGTNTPSHAHDATNAKDNFEFSREVRYVQTRNNT